MTVITELLTTVGAVTAVVILLLMAAIPLLIDLPLHSRVAERTDQERCGPAGRPLSRRP